MIYLINVIYVSHVPDYQIVLNGNVEEAVSLLSVSKIIFSSGFLAFSDCFI
jgi:hypothetical protein